MRFDDHCRVIFDIFAQTNPFLLRHLTVNLNDLQIFLIFLNFPLAFSK
ncbi:hypothetical protein ANACOL_01886 [Anaerotruncus colihominis DSM 17241]|uniref:Uncharacterized protein n=1 Tax=Anaerotruncus colihominis DSM 17241 TaxID=445972 RepID=B0PAT5_9FIRM|nr:hypothetical protein ANACOL_01886 [Anaerotruncus colihominis DSM 17241]